MRWRRWGLSLVITGTLLAGRPGYALPSFSRQFNVGCSTCHSIPPRLNEFGLAFQANHFNWPAGQQKKRGIESFPISGIGTYSLEDNHTEGHTTAAFRELELFVANGFQAGSPSRQGGFWINVFPYFQHEEEGERAGNLEGAWLAFPLGGHRGQTALTLGQFSPLMFQWDEVNKLTDSAPFAIGDDLDEFGFTEPMPGLRLDYFDHRAQGTADGTYLSVGVPFKGHLAFNSDADIGGPRGVWAHAFRRWGYTSLGVFGFTHAGNHLEGIMATQRVLKNLYLLEIAANGHDEDGDTQRLSLEAEYVFSQYLALTGRLDVLGGAQDDVAPTAAVTFYPFKQHWVRLTGEMTQRKGDRANYLFVRGQF